MSASKKDAGYEPPAYSSHFSGAGNRIPVSTTSAIQLESLGSTDLFDLGGENPVFVCSAILRDSVQPAKYAPHLGTPCRYAYGGKEIEHQGRFDVLPITSDMEWVSTSNGEVPPGRRPVEGGYESNGNHLFHALVLVDRLQVPGKTGRHLGGAHVPWAGAEKVIRDKYQILCWN